MDEKQGEGITRPLCVDLDGTLLKTDSLVEGLLLLIKEQPLTALKIPFWLAQGKAHLKHRVAQYTSLAATLLPYNTSIVEYAKKESVTRPVLLVTGSARSVADSVASHFGFFSGVIASDAETNMTGLVKRDALVNQFGKQGFDYIGNSKADWPVWSETNEALIAAQQGPFLEQTIKRFSPSKIFYVAQPGIRTFAKAIRVHQWLKNLLIFVPLLLEHRLADMAALTALLVCFLSLSLLASATYLLNDLLDLEADRNNSTKRYRALASGVISPKIAVILAAVLLLGSLLLAQMLPFSFLIVLLLYGVTTLTYSFWLKRAMIVDVCVLASLFTLRIIGGGVVIGAEWSFWLLAFSMFFFLSLALGKRASELANAKKENKKIIGRAYTVDDLQMLLPAGLTAGFISVLIIALYINSDKVIRMYEVPQILWMVCPMLLYWVGRFWMIVSRGGMHEDPIIFAIRDRISLGTVAICGAIVVVASNVASYL